MIERPHTITTTSAHGLRAGDVVTIIDFRPWWVRLWRWLTHYKPPAITVTNVTSTTITSIGVVGIERMPDA